MGSFQVARVASELLVLSSLCLSAFAAPTTSGNSTKQWTFSEVRAFFKTFLYRMCYTYLTRSLLQRISNGINVLTSTLVQC
jgi:hypothetical protein